MADRLYHAVLVEDDFNLIFAATTINDKSNIVVRKLAQSFVIKDGVVYCYDSVTLNPSASLLMPVLGQRRR
jgi:hypothetical protein